MFRVVFACLLLTVAACADAGDWSARVTGSFQYDYGHHRDGAIGSSDHGWRRSRLGLASTLPAGVDARFEFDLDSNTWTDAWLRLKPGRGHQIRIGQYKQPLFLDELSSDRNSAFLEQALPTSLVIARRLGVEYSYGTDAYRLSLSRYDGTLAGTHQGQAWVARALWLPWRQGNDLLHLAFAHGREQPAGGLIRLRSRAEGAPFLPIVVDSGTLRAVEHVDRSGIEALWLRGAWSAQAEYLQARISRQPGLNAKLSGWYAQLSWFASGDRRGYKDGAVDKPDLGEDGRGLELALRLSGLDLDDGSVRGGQIDNTGLGVIYYAHPQVRVMANWIHVHGERAERTLGPRILGARLQFSF